jgi:hypothetical protein
MLSEVQNIESVYIFRHYLLIDSMMKSRILIPVLSSSKSSVFWENIADLTWIISAGLQKDPMDILNFRSTFISVPTNSKIVDQYYIMSESNPTIVLLFISLNMWFCFKRDREDINQIYRITKYPRRSTFGVYS